MAVKYQIEWYDTENSQHIVTISDPNYIGDPIEVNGYCELLYVEVSELLQPLRGVGLRVYLDADQDMTFEDLYSEQDRVFEVDYVGLKDGRQPYFKGWIDSENWYEDFVNDKWVVSFDCLDGFGYLEDLAYVQETGAPYIGKERQSIVLNNCIKRISSQQSNIIIYTDIDIFYTGLADTESILYNVYVNQNRYIKDDGETIMSCAEVIKDILEPYGAIIIQDRNSWLITKPNQIYNRGEIPNLKAHVDGNYVSNTNGFDLDISINKDDGTKESIPHYAGGNQSIRLNKSIGAYRINYKYGTTKSLSDNPNFYTADGSTFDGWTVNSPSLITTNGADSYGVNFDSALLQPRNLLMTSESFSLQADNIVNVRFQFDVEYLDINADFHGYFYYQVVLVSQGATYYLTQAREWSTTPSYKRLSILSDTSYNEFVSTTVLPDDGELEVRLIEPDQEESPIDDPTNFTIKMTNFVLSFDEDRTELLLEGETHTFQRVSQPSAKIPDNKEVITGDIPNEIYLGTTYENDETTPTSTWYRKGVTEAKPLLQIMGEETMKLNAKVSRVLSGSVYGYFPYISRVTLEGLNGVFMVTKYNYNAYENIVQAEFKQIFNEDISDDLFYEKTEDFGNTVTPTIIG